MPISLRSLRVRLALAFLFWTAAIQVVVSLVFLASRELVVMRDMDSALVGAVERLAPVLQGERSWPPALDEAAFAVQSQQGAPLVQLVLRARADDGSTLSVWPDAEPARLLDTSPGATNMALRTCRITPRGADEQSAAPTARYRVATVAIRTNGGASYMLDAATSLEFIDGITMLIIRLMGAGLLVGVFGAAVAGWIVAGRMVGRLEQVTEEVSDVSADRLDAPRELPEGGDEIGRMAQAVNAMLRRLSSAFRSQEFFISNVSHELKTPVAALLAEAQVLKGGEGHDSPETYRRFVLSVEDETRRIGSLVETFLALARFSDGRGALPDTEVSLNDVAVDSVQICDPLATERSVRLQVQLSDPSAECPEPVVRGDAGLLRIVADNLIRNAVQFSSRGGSVEIATACENGYAVLWVADSGPGVPQEFLDRIFDRHVQAPNRSVGQRGTGLGLNIAHTIVQLHRGTVDVRNREPAGCVFTVRLPLATPSDQSTKTSS